ncbi:MAG: hypothetical protein R2939_10650 [Kofleriaceae bacterium]
MVINTRNLLIAAAVVAVAAGTWWWRTRSPTLTPEQQVAALIAGAVEDAEDGDVGGLLDRVSESYEGEGGNRKALRGYLMGLLLRGGITVKVLAQAIEVTEPTATAELEVVLVRGGIVGVAQGDAGMRGLQLDLVREDGAWKVRGAALLR